jgi:DNA polymerase
MTELFFDTETYCETPIQRGTHRYAEGAEIMVSTWAIGDAPVQTEDYVSDACGPSDELWRLLKHHDTTVIMHKSDFDRTMVRHAWGLVIPIERVHDTMVQAMAHSLPGGLDKLCDIFQVDADEAKLKTGKALIQLFCKPRPKNVKIRRATPWTHPKEWAEFLLYAASDIPSMRAIVRKMPNWNYTGRELELWRLDQKVNDRGFQADMELAQAALGAIALEQKHLAERTQELTNGEVEKATKRDEMLAHILSEYGVDLPDMKKDTLERRIEDPELPDALRQLLRVRLQSTTTSTAKYNAMIRSVSDDGRLRAGLQFCGAIRTGRWGGRLFQPQNLPRPDMVQDKIDFAIEAIKSGDADLILDDVMKALSNMLRGMIVAGPGRKLVAADLEQIESRIAAWLGQEQWKLDAIAEYDTGEGFDNYAWAYARAFGITPEAVMANKKAGGFWRQVGKVMELALAYEGGVGAWLAFAAVYRLELEALAQDAYPRIPEAARTQAEIMLQWRKKKGLTTFGLTDKAFVVIESFKALWRTGHPGISGYWGELEEAAMEAVSNPNRRAGVEVGALTFKKQGTWLRMILPSGRSLCYPAPRITGNGRDKKLSYLGVNQYTRRWHRQGTYGGKLFENACQAVARDVMAWNMPAIEDAGYRIVLTVHDEVITEPLDNDDMTSDHLSRLLASNPPWLPGCPLAAGGFEAQRYRKD